jgi:hypothetical protein
MSVVMLDALVLLAVVVVCWLVTDARPAFALSLAVLIWVVSTLPEDGYGDPYILLIQSAVVLSVLVPAAWLLFRRQNGPGSRPHPEP